MMKISQFDIEFDRLVRVGHLKAVDELNATPANELDIGNPNHPIHDGIFGYETSEFLAKQRK